MSKTYSEKLKSPKWQKKRLQIMERDGFQCQCCFDRDETLTVHHKLYIKGKEPWEYEDQHLITLCENCHESVHIIENNYKTNKSNYIFSHYGFNITDYRIFLERIRVLYELEGVNALTTANKLLTAYTISIKDI